MGLDEIERNDFNLNLPRYIDGSEPEDRQDIAGHLQGGIPEADVEALDRYWSLCPGLGAVLFKANRPGYLDLLGNKAAIKATIHGHPEFTAFVTRMNEHFNVWRAAVSARLKALEPGFHPKELIAEVSENLLAHYLGQPLVDPYDIYQHLMDYWAQTMQDDAYQLTTEGWKASTYRVMVERKKDGKVVKVVDKGWACDLVPKPLLVARYFAAEQAAINELIASLDSAVARRTELEEEHFGEDAAFWSFDKVTVEAVKERMRELRDDADAADEVAVLKDWLALAAEESALKSELKKADAALDAAALARYPKLKPAEVQQLVVDDKWLATLGAIVHGEMDRISQQLTTRVRELAERYESPLPSVIARVSDLQQRVDRHLLKMGFAWK